MKQCILFFIISFAALNAQTVQANVSVSADKFDGSQKEEIKDLANVLANYINTKNWTLTDVDDVIEINISIIIESTFKAQGQTAYKAQLLINSPAQENFYDKKFEFFYKINESINTDGARYQTIGNTIDFYVNMVLAGEMDTYYEYGGNKFYNEALQSLTLGLTNKFSGGWVYRERVYNDNTSSFVKSLRIAKYNYYVALNYSKEKDFLNMRKYAHKVVDDVVIAYERQPNNLMLKQFLEGYHKGIIEILDPEFDQSYIRKMIAVDPIRRSFYSDYLKD